jgi:putative membrane protein
MTRLAVAFITIGFATAAFADLTAADRKFVENAAIGGMAEVELGKVATARASSAQVRQFAQRMINDHRKANEALRKVAAGKGIQVPTSLDQKHQKDVDEMQKKDAKKFDHEYMEMMVKDHKKDVAEFRKAAKDAKDRDIKAFASGSLPTLKDQLQMAVETRAGLARR